MTINEIESKLTDIYRDVFDDEGLVLSDDMTSDDIPDWDSLTHLQLIMQVEQVFGVRFTTAQIKETARVGALKALIAGLTAGGADS